MRTAPRSRSDHERSLLSLAGRLAVDWYAPRLTPLTAALWPLALVFRAGVALRRALFRTGILPSKRLPVPVIIVGNIVVGGVGKTPLACTLAAALARDGWRPGIVSRGYGGSSVAPREVTQGDDPAVVGDEPLLLAATGFPVWIGRDRVAAARAVLVAHPDCSVIIADDGLQHYALCRDIEIAVIDASRGLGNGAMLPAGPLREPVTRLAAVDAIVRLVAWGTALPAARDRGRESAMTHEPLAWRNLANPAAIADPRAWRAGSVHAIAGTGNPRRFFDLVRTLGFEPVCHAFPDHHRYVREDLALPGASTILMTEKDAVKCAGLVDARCWMLPIRAVVDPVLIALVEEKLRGLQVA